MRSFILYILQCLIVFLASRYPSSLDALSAHVKEPGFPYALCAFIFTLRHPNSDVPSTLHQCPEFYGYIRVFHSATVRFYAPSDLCGTGGMHRKQIRANPKWSDGPRYDTVFVSMDESSKGMEGLMVAQICLLFSFLEPKTCTEYSCALVCWFPCTDIHPDESAELWVVKPEQLPRAHSSYPVQVINLNTIMRGAHLLPCFGSGFLPENFSYINALNAFVSYYINLYIDHHTHELIR